MAERAGTATDCQRMVVVMSGKGGTGKSLVTALLAVVLRRQGLRVGVLDGDLNGMGIAYMFGLQDARIVAHSEGVEPLRSKSGIKILSMSMLLGDEPVVWRESMLAGAFRQCYRDVQWGALDCLLVDGPCGTSDVSMAILESLPLTGVVIVASCQRVANITVKKCISMVKQYKTPVLGLVENSFPLPESNEKPSAAAESSSSAALLELAGAPLLARLPVDRELALLCDAGRIEECQVERYKTLLPEALRSVTRAE